MALVHCGAYYIITYFQNKNLRKFKQSVSQIINNNNK